MNSFKNYAIVFIVAAAGSIAGASILSTTTKGGTFFTKRNEVQLPVKNVVYDAVTPQNLDFTPAAEHTVSTVVHVKTTYQNQNNFQSFDPFQFFWGQPMPQQQQQQQATGSGVILSDDGYIVTNNHVVEDASQVEVTLDDKRTYKAEVIGTDPSTDLALLKIDEKGLNYAVYGNSDNVKVGEWVLAVGNPFNLTSTVTAGIVSAKARNIHILPNQKFPIESFIQTDAAVNPGNSGGALVNTRGELIGINAAIASNTGSYSGYSFAIPVTIVKKVVDDLLEFGKVQRGFIGVSIKDIDADLAKAKSIKKLDGVYVDGLTDGGAAQSAGIKIGDVITKINDATIKTSPALQEQVGRYRPGDKIKVTVLRNEAEKEIEVVLKNKDGNTSILKNEVGNALGATLENVSDDELGKLGIGAGVKIKELQSGKLKSSGVREGFIITSIDNTPMKTTSDVTNYLKDKKGGVLIEGIYDNGMKAYYGFGL
ncbi:MAG: Do family serine endopeptidase [Bacteroidota bacterium]